MGFRPPGGSIPLSHSGTLVLCFSYWYWYWTGTLILWYWYCTGTGCQCPDGTHPEHFQPKTRNRRFTHQIIGFKLWFRLKQTDLMKAKSVADRLSSAPDLSVCCSWTVFKLFGWQTNTEISKHNLRAAHISHISQTYLTYLKPFGC